MSSDSAEDDDKLQADLAFLEENVRIIETPFTPATASDVNWELFNTIPKAVLLSSLKKVNAKVSKDRHRYMGKTSQKGLASELQLLRQSTQKEADGDDDYVGSREILFRAEPINTARLPKVWPVPSKAASSRKRRRSAAAGAPAADEEVEAEKRQQYTELRAQVEGLSRRAAVEQGRAQCYAELAEQLESIPLDALRQECLGSDSSLSRELRTSAQLVTEMHTTVRALAANRQLTLHNPPRAESPKGLPRKSGRGPHRDRGSPEPEDADESCSDAADNGHVAEGTRGGGAVPEEADKTGRVTRPPRDLDGSVALAKRLCSLAQAVSCV
eukprot:jgi/Mesvir1/20093/Mv13337-RA.1